MRKDPFNANGEKYSFYRMQTLSFPSNTSFSISQTAIMMLKDLYQEGTAYKKAGVIVSEIVPSSQRQFKLFDEENPKYQKLMEVMDAVQAKTGERKLRLASQDLKRTWKMKQNHLSNRYTTNFNELLEVKCK